MCGIVGYIGQKQAYPILIKGLKRLEYRGYDSAGVALISEQRQLNVYKAKGKVAELETFVQQKDISGNIGIAHTRWATHGEPCPANAHPHYSSSQRLALIHNGIIENYATLKDKLQAKGYAFRSSTDTEVLVQLIEYTDKVVYLERRRDCRHLHRTSRNNGVPRPVNNYGAPVTAGVSHRRVQGDGCGPAEVTKKQVTDKQ